MADDEAQCIICFEAGAPAATCGCINVHIHTECLKRTIECTNTAHCKVCLKPYPNVRVKTTVTRQCHKHYVYTIVLFCFDVFYLGLVAFLAHKPGQDAIVLCIVVSIAAAVSTSITVLMAVDIYRRRVTCCVEHTRVTKVVVVNR